MIIQLGHPKIKQESFPLFATVREAFLHLFRAEEESIYLFWHTIPLRFRYREDLYRNFDSILAMVWLIQRDDQGATKVEFTNQLLTIRWEIRWEGDDLAIHSFCSALDDLYEAYAQALNQWPEVKITKQAFLNEWKTLLHQIIVAFQYGQVKIEDGTERRKWEMLQRVEGQMAQYGQLYIRRA
jgi:hypothetical protein